MKHTMSAGALAAVLLAACGGGGGGGETATSTPTAAATPPASTALADNSPPAGFDFATSRPAAGLRSTEIVPDPGRYADPARTYVSFWIPGAESERQQLALLSLQQLRALDDRGGLVLALPASVKNLHYEVWDQGGPASALSGEVAR